jgi:hypothetical protein
MIVGLGSVLICFAKIKLRENRAMKKALKRFSESALGYMSDSSSLCTESLSVVGRLES